MKELILILIITMILIIIFIKKFIDKDIKFMIGFTIGILSIIVLLWQNNFVNRKIPHKPITNKDFKIIQQLIVE